MRLSKFEDLDPDITPRKIIKWVVVGTICIGALGVVASYTGMFSSVATAPSRVIERTMKTDNIINNYEWFHDANAQYKSRLGQITDFKKQLESVKDDDRQEKNRLNVDLGATRQSCRDLATRYNANATKSNRSIFMGKEAPESLNMEACG